MFGPYLVIYPTSGKELLKKGISLWSIGNTFLLGKVPKHPEGGRGAVSHGLTFKNVSFFRI